MWPTDVLEMNYYSCLVSYINDSGKLNWFGNSAKKITITDKVNCLSNKKFCSHFDMTPDHKQFNQFRFLVSTMKVRVPAETAATRTITEDIESSRIS